MHPSMWHSDQYSESLLIIACDCQAWHAYLEDSDIDLSFPLYLFEVLFDPNVSSQFYWSFSQLPLSQQIPHHSSSSVFSCLLSEVFQLCLLLLTPVEIKTDEKILRRVRTTFGIHYVQLGRVNNWKHVMVKWYCWDNSNLLQLLWQELFLFDHRPDQLRAAQTSRVESLRRWQQWRRLQLKVFEEVPCLWTVAPSYCYL